jgi:hypothetical protein
VKRICSECGLARNVDAFRDGVDATVCAPCRYSSLTWGRADERAYDVHRRDKEFAKDAEAYWRLRRQGQQPLGIDKSAMAEAMADHPMELAIGRSLHRIEREALVRQNGTI